jgi:hypothetical protein
MKAFARLLTKVGAAPSPPLKVFCPDRVPQHNVDSTFFESQQSLGCGRHALNNLLGGRYFVKEGQYVPGVNPIPLDGLCQSLKSSMQAINASKGEVWNARRLAEAACQDSENYDQNTLKAGLNILGFHVEADKGRDVTDSSRTYGFLINTARAGFHWVSLRKVNEGYRYFDSMNAKHGRTNPTGELFASLKEFKDSHSSYPVFLEIIKPEPRICIEPLRDYGTLHVVDCPFNNKDIISFEGTNYTVINRHMNGTECDYLDVVRSDIYDPRLSSNIQSSVNEVRMFLDGTLLKMLIRDGNIVGFISRDVVLLEMKARIDEKVESAFITKNKSAASKKSYTNILELQGRLDAAIRGEGVAGAAAVERNARAVASAASGAASHPWEELGMTEEEYKDGLKAEAAAAEAKLIKLRREAEELKNKIAAAANAATAKARAAAANAAAANAAAASAAAANAAAIAEARQRNAAAIAEASQRNAKAISAVDNLRIRRIENGKTPVEHPWIMMISKTKGIPYYVHLKSGDKRWNHPVLRPIKGGRRSTHRRQNKNMRNRTRGRK